MRSGSFRHSARRLAIAGPVAALVIAAIPGLAAASSATPGSPFTTTALAIPIAPGGHGHGGGGGGGGGGGSLTGYDISYPQCGGAFPTNVSFGIVGVNRGIVYSPNPCLGADGPDPSELQWAEQNAPTGEHAQLYANTANPGPALSSYWPTGQTTPRFCDPSQNDTADCAYDYGWNAAADSYQNAVDAYASLGIVGADSTATPDANAWWLDVETANSWRTDVGLNVAALQGAVDYLLSRHVASVGFYSSGSMWATITGGTSAFTAYPTWVAGARSLRGATKRCAGSGFTGGTVALAQYFAGGFDADLAC